MSGKQRRSGGLADPVRMRSLDADDKHLVIVVIETPKGSRNKYAYDPKEHIFELKKVLPAGMAFPYDFGFVPSTRGGDGDPLDVLVLMDEPAFPVANSGAESSESSRERKATRKRRSATTAWWRSSLPITAMRA